MCLVSFHRVIYVSSLPRPLIASAIDATSNKGRRARVAGSVAEQWRPRVAGERGRRACRRSRAPRHASAAAGPGGRGPGARAPPMGAALRKRGSPSGNRQPSICASRKGLHVSFALTTEERIISDEDVSSCNENTTRTTKAHSVTSCQKRDVRKSPQKRWVKKEEKCRPRGGKVKKGEAETKLKKGAPKVVGEKCQGERGTRSSSGGKPPHDSAHRSSPAGARPRAGQWKPPSSTDVLRRRDSYKRRSK